MNSKKFIRTVSVIALILFLAVGFLGALSAAARPVTMGASDQFLPAMYRPLPTSTPTATPTPTATVPPANVIVNGNFEAGPAGWQQYSSNGWQLILNQANLPVPAHGGSWAAWLGGDNNEDSILSQNLTVPTVNSTLTYWLWLQSADSCGDDIGGVLVNEDAVDAYWLCAGNNTGGWIRRDINLAAYGGQSVELVFAAFTNSNLISNMLLDDISLGLSLFEPETGETNGSPAAPLPKAQTGLEPETADTVPDTIIKMRARLQEFLASP